MDKLEEKENVMNAFEKCPVCSGELINKKVEKLLRGGQNTAILKVSADVCLLCGEHLYSEETVRKFENIRTKLKRKETSEFKLVGQTFSLA